MKAGPRRRTASSRGSNPSPPAKGDGDVAAADGASVMAWVPSRPCRSEPTPPQLFPTNLAPRPAAEWLSLAAERPPPGLLVIDGLDEVTGWKFDATVLPPDPPPRLRIVLSARIRHDELGAEGWLGRLGWDRTGATEDGSDVNRRPPRRVRGRSRNQL